MEDDLNISENGRQPNSLVNGRRPYFFSKLEGDLNFFKNGRQPQYFEKWRTTTM
jgi:hypothetical protein